MRIKRWLKGSAYSMHLPEGCIHCARGGKLVLLVTGKCNSGCYYCPLSAKKKGKAVIYADELLVKDDEDILGEARLIGATGTGVTGGDPLLRPSDTARLISLLKEEFGERHHIHLYSGLADIKSIEAVASAGLDEMRFHPPVSIWGKLEGSKFDIAIEAAKDLGMAVGIEIPSLPGMEDDTRTLLEYASQAELSFVNLNELEFTEANWDKLSSRGFVVKGDISSGAKGSQSKALRLIADGPEGLPLHYCSSSFKDSVQLRRRISRRGRNIKRPLDLLTKDGTRVFGIIESKNPAATARLLHEQLKVPNYLIETNREMRRVEVASWIIEEIVAELDEDAFIVEEYPTADRLEVEREPVKVKRR